MYHTVVNVAARKIIFINELYLCENVRAVFHVVKHTPHRGPTYSEMKLVNRSKYLHTNTSA